MGLNDLADIADMNLADIGALARRRRRSGGVPRRRLIPGTPGVPLRGLREQSLPLGATAFTASSGTTLTLTASPQRPFRGRRLVIDITRTGTTSTGLVSVTAINIGADNQLPTGTGSMPAAMFGATAVGVDLDLDPATPGVTVTVGLAISAAPTMTDRVDVGAAIIGEVIG